MCISLLGLLGVVYFCSIIHKNDKTISLLSITTSLVIFWYRNELQYNNQTVLPAKIATTLILFISSISYLRHRNVIKTLLLVWILWSSLLMRPHNIILIPVCVTASKILRKLCSSVKCLTLMHIWLAMVLFHCQVRYTFISIINYNFKRTF